MGKFLGSLLAFQIFIFSSAFAENLEPRPASAVWTGSKLIIWYASEGYGRSYDFVNAKWTKLSTAGAPSAGDSQSVVWAGSTMLVWGGCNQSNNGWSYSCTSDGYAYDPATDSWQKIATTNAPSARFGQSAVWTGDKLVVFGGKASGLRYDTQNYLSDGRIYDPKTDSWSQMASVPLEYGRYPYARLGQLAVWTGSEMIVYGGHGPSSLLEPYGTNARGGGWIYNLRQNSWRGLGLATDCDNDLAFLPSVTWMGSKLFVWGGYDSATYLTDSTGSVYDPQANKWNCEQGPDMLDRWAGTLRGFLSRAGLYAASSVWTGSEVIIWGGAKSQGYGTEFPVGTNEGWIFNPMNSKWKPMNTDKAPAPRIGDSTLWTGSKLIVYGHSPNESVGVYDPKNDRWKTIN